MFNFFKKEQPKAEKFQNPIAGKVVGLAEVPDQAFSQGLLGEGYAIEPTEGKVYAPMSGTVGPLFPTGHAVGVTTKEGYEILIHLGIDTVELEGQGFTTKVTDGQKVKQGDLLIEMDVEKVKELGKPTICPVVFTSGQHVTVAKIGENVEALDETVLTVNQ